MAGTRAAKREDSRLRILEGALDVFSRQGYNETSIKDVADAAGINSPGLIYHYFENKLELLNAVLQHYAPPLKLLDQMDTISRLPVREALLLFANAYLKVMDNPRVGGCMRVMIGEALRSPDFAQILGEAGPLRIWEILSDYLKEQMQLGSIRTGSPQVAARCFIGPLFVHVFVRTMARLPDHLEISPQDFATACVDQFLQGAAPAQSAWPGVK